MGLDVAEELASPGAVAWSLRSEIAVGAHRSSADAVKPDWDGVERHFCFGVSETPCDVDVEGEGRMILGPDVVRFHNPGDRIRSLVSADAECRSSWVLLDQHFVEAILSNDAGAHRPKDARAFERSFVEASLPDLATLRTFFRLAENGASPFWIEETVASLLPRLMRFAGTPDGRGRDAPSLRQRALVRDADALLAHHYAGTFTLSDVARQLGVSSPHLARTYRAVTGRRMHSRLTSLRIAAALERLADGADDLTGLGLDLGYADHSHFSAAFRRHVGVPPSHFRASFAAASNIR